MSSIRIVVIGGGPAGLLTARLLAREGFGVTLYERLDPRSTYGFGVALAGPAIERLRRVDPEAAERIEPICLPLRRWTMRREEESASVEDRGASGVQRTGLLRTLQDLAAEAGARIEAGTAARIDEVADGADVVVCADGVGSQAREALAARVGARVETVPIPYMWCGANLELDAMTLFLRRTPHGVFCGHVMPYGDGDCTFQVDTVPAALRSAGLAVGQGEGDAGSDEESLAFLAEVFRPLLGERELLGNRSRWSTFRLVTCERWSAGKCVLLGDAAHTAHYTVGSGTRMAMEDAIAFSEALSGEGGLEAAFASFERDRRAAVERLQWRAMRSQTWWRTLAGRYDLPLPVLLFSYFTRTGGVGLERLARSNPDIVAAAVAHWSGGEAANWAGEDPRRALLGSRLLGAAEARDGFTVVPCDGVAPWSEQSRSLPAGLAGDGDRGVLLTGRDCRRSLLDRFDVAEELRAAGGVKVAVALPAGLLDDAATAIAAGRTDYVVTEE
ncbi:MAG: FAD-dependent monooxygenase [Actinobacteria bacterium]|nr:FAD-dependent monooxygenase [Actinomycetota bacterium]